MLQIGLRFWHPSCAFAFHRLVCEHRKCAGNIQPRYLLFVLMSGVCCRVAGVCACMRSSVFCLCIHLRRRHNVNVHTSRTGTLWHNKHFRLLLAGIPAQEALVLVVLIVGAAHWGIVVVALRRGEEKTGRDRWALKSWGWQINGILRAHVGCVWFSGQTAVAGDEAAMPVSGPQQIFYTKK